jgi:hypothetical protein
MASSQAISIFQADQDGRGSVKAILLVSPLMMLISQVAIGQSNAAPGAAAPSVQQSTPAQATTSTSRPPKDSYLKMELR